MAAMAAPLIVSVIWSLTLAKTWQKRAHEDLNKKRLMNLNLPGLKVRNSERWDFDVFRCFLYVVFFNHVISYWLIYIYIYDHWFIILYPTVTAERCWEQVHPIPGDLPAQSRKKKWCHRRVFREFARPFFAEGFVSGSWKQMIFPWIFVSKKKRRKTWRN